MPAVALASALVLGILITLADPHMLWLAAIPAWIALSRHGRMGCRHRCLTLAARRGRVRRPAIRAPPTS